MTDPHHLHTITFIESSEAKVPSSRGAKQKLRHPEERNKNSVIARSEATWRSREPLRCQTPGDCRASLAMTDPHHLHTITFIESSETKIPSSRGAKRRGDLVNHCAARHQEIAALRSP